MDDTTITLEEFREPIVAYPVCVRAEPGLLRQEELTTYHTHAEPLAVGIAGDGTVMVHLRDGRTITIGTCRTVKYCQCVIEVAVYRDGQWEMPGGIAECIADTFVSGETAVPFGEIDC
jgi:hypothetical protein